MKPSLPVKCRQLPLFLAGDKTIKGLLASCLGIRPVKTDHRQDFMDVFGAWSGREAEDFKKNTKDLEKVDQGDWK